VVPADASPAGARVAPGGDAAPGAAAAQAGPAAAKVTPTVAAKPAVEMPSDDPKQLLDLARVARRKGELVAPPGRSAVDLLLAATAAGATGRTVAQERGKLVRDLVRAAKHAQRGRKWAHARDAWNGVLKLRPGDAAASKGLHRAEAKLK
jgi:L-alanine-DL-glutamate epimerase-like enolase superfamily enzyme